MRSLATTPAELRPQMIPPLARREGSGKPHPPSAGSLLGLQQGLDCLVSVAAVVWQRLRHSPAEQCCCLRICAREPPHGFMLHRSSRHLIWSPHHRRTGRVAVLIVEELALGLHKTRDIADRLAVIYVALEPQPTEKSQ